MVLLSTKVGFWGIKNFEKSYQMAIIRLEVPRAGHVYQCERGRGECHEIDPHPPGHDTATNPSFCITNKPCPESSRRNCLISRYARLLCYCSSFGKTSTSFSNTPLFCYNQKKPHSTNICRATRICTLCSLQPRHLHAIPRNVNPTLKRVKRN